MLYVAKTLLCQYYGLRGVKLTVGCVAELFVVTWTKLKGQSLPHIFLVTNSFILGRSLFLQNVEQVIVPRITFHAVEYTEAAVIEVLQTDCHTTSTSSATMVTL